MSFAEKYADTITHSISETEYIIHESPVRWGAVREFGWRMLEIFIGGKWYPLCRTDLKDNCATCFLDLYVGTTDEIRERFKSMIRYGGRLDDDAEHPYFAVIDRYSDG